MKNISEEVLFEALGEIDDELLEEAYDIDDEKKLKEIKQNSKNKTFVFTPMLRRVTVAFVSLVVMIAAAVNFINLSKSKIPVVEEDFVSNEESIITDTQNDSVSSSTNTQSELETSSSASSSDNSSDFESSNASQTFENATSSDNTLSEEVDSENSENEFEIKSLDEINFYTAKKILSDRSLLPLSNTLSPSQVKTVILNEGEVYCYKIDKNTKITVSMITYFTVNLSNEKGFLAQKLGGTGLVEVVITANSLDNMITFKRGENYYSCLWDSTNYTGDGSNTTMSMSFSTHKYIEGFNLIKNFEQESFQFNIFFEGSKVVRIECECYNNVMQSQYFPDEITLTNDGCIVMFVNESVTIDQLEGFVIKNGFEKENKA